MSTNNGGSDLPIYKDRMFLTSFVYKIAINYLNKELTPILYLHDLDLQPISDIKVLMFFISLSFALLITIDTLVVAFKCHARLVFRTQVLTNYNLGMAKIQVLDRYRLNSGQKQEVFIDLN